MPRFQRRRHAQYRTASATGEACADLGYYREPVTGALSLTKKKGGQIILFIRALDFEINFFVSVRNVIPFFPQLLKCQFPVLMFCIAILSALTDQIRSIK